MTDSRDAKATSEAGDALRFGEALEELEDIVRSLESGQLDLEESLEVYQRGVALLKAAQAKLASAEQKVTSLLEELESDEAETPADVAE